MKGLRRPDESLERAKGLALLGCVLAVIGLGLVGHVVIDRMIELEERVQLLEDLYDG